MAQNKWRLKKTLNRKVEFRPSEAEDIAYAWAGYKKGTFDRILPDGLGPEEFNVGFQNVFGERYDHLWTMYAETKKGFIPVGFASGFWPFEAAQPFLILEALWWFPWASPRNRIESTVNFCTEMKKEGVPMMAFVHEPDKKFMEVLAKHGLIRRVGTSYVCFPGERATVWEMGDK